MSTMKLKSLPICAAASIALLLGAAAAQTPSGPKPANTPSGAPATGPGGSQPEINIEDFFKPRPIDHHFDDLNPPLTGQGLGGYAAGLDAPLPASSPEPAKDPRNLEGTWTHRESLVFLLDKDSYGMRPPYNARSHHLLAARLKALAQGKPYLNPSASCHPPGLPWQQDINAPFSIFQAKDRIDVIYYEYHGQQIIYLNPAKAPKTPSYTGTSIGHWDGDTLVVVTSNMKQPQWLDVDGTPISAAGVITQRIRKIWLNRWVLDIETTIDDPTYYNRPWNWVHSYSWTPDSEVFGEYDCETQAGDKANNANVGLLPEPASDDQP